MRQAADIYDRLLQCRLVDPFWELRTFTKNAADPAAIARLMSSVLPCDVVQERDGDCDDDNVKIDGWIEICNDNIDNDCDSFLDENNCESGCGASLIAVRPTPASAIALFGIGLALFGLGRRRFGFGSR